MALPMNSAPIYTLTIPSTGKPMKFRPFLVKDEKALLVAQQSEDPVVMLDTVKEVIMSCLKTELDVDKLTSFDIEYIFLQLRSRSVGEMVELLFQCDIDHGEDNEKAISRVGINLNDVKVERFEGHTQKIELFGDVGLALKYPTVETMKKMESADPNNIDEQFDIVIDCIDYIWDGEQVFSTEDQSRQELIDFLENLTSDQFEKVQKFFQTMPSLRVYFKYTCAVCGREHNKYLEGLASFF